MANRDRCERESRESVLSVYLDDDDDDDSITKIINKQSRFDSLWLLAFLKTKMDAKVKKNMIR